MDIENFSSKELINLLAQKGIGIPCCDNKNETRTAYVAEYGTFTTTGKKYVKIVVRSNSDDLYDYGARIWVPS